MHFGVFIHHVDYDSFRRLQKPKKAVKVKSEARWQRVIARVLDKVLTLRKLPRRSWPEHAFQDNIVRAFVVRWELVAVLRRTYPAQD